MNVINKYVALAFFALCSFSTYAQVSLGFKGGMHYANVNIDGIPDNLATRTKYINNLSFGLVSEIPLGGGFSVQPELSFLKKGFKINEGLDLGVFGVPLPLGVKAQVEMKYIDLPILGKYNVDLNERLNAYVVAGPAFGYARSAKVQTIATVIVEIPISTNTIDLSNENAERFEVSGTIGAGLAFNTYKGKLFADARYTHGFSKIDNISLIDTKSSNKGFGFNVGYLIPLNRSKKTRS